ncbi:MAG TPA: DUF378 domain-containing protein [Candidatus Levybacteria bacterium]|nr:DUF378 domain-containing protein [Candidatus Levybacteria bacterium]
MTTYVLVIIGALNWGIIGVLGVNFINVLLAGSPVVEKIIYILVGASAVYDIMIARGMGRSYSKKKK